MASSLEIGKNFTALPLVNPPSFRARAAIGRSSRRGSLVSCADWLTELFLTRFQRRSLVVKALLFPILLWSLLLSNEANAKECSIPQFRFRVTSQGPWPAHMTVQSGQSCGSRHWRFGGIFRQLYLASPPRHGKVVLSFPGGYRYFPAPGYLGDDSFTLKICGTMNGGFEGCADLLFGVIVTPSGA